MFQLPDNRENPYASPQSVCEPAGRDSWYTPERAYRWSVLPFGVFMMVGGIILFASSVLAPSNSISMPPLQDPWLKRVVFGGLALCVALLGLGFCRRSRVAWWGFFAYLLLGTVWQMIVGILNSQFLPLVLAPAFNLSFALGIYWAMKPVFAPRRGPLRKAAHSG